MFRFISLTAASVLALSLCLGPARAQDVPTSQEIVDALLPTGLEGRRINGARSLDGLLGGQPDRRRGVKIEGGSEVPFIDLRINFEYASDALSNDAFLTLGNLAEAMQSEALSEQVFRIVGHTDAIGDAAYNQALSERRAEAVLSYLEANHGIPRARVVMAASGESELISGIAPEDERNRRVEVQNITQVARN